MKRTFKQIVLTAAVLLTLGVTTSFAAAKDGKTDNNGATASFRKEFKQAEVLSTDAGKGYTKITFRLNGAILTAFYNGNNELLAITHNILSTELPISLMMQIKQDYSSYWISDLFEFDHDGTTCYYITLENGDTQLTLRSNENQWETYSKFTKE